MSIERRSFHCYVCVCNECGVEISGGDSFTYAVRRKKEEGWRSRLDEQGDWMDLCPDCQKMLMKGGKRDGKAR